MIGKGEVVLMPGDIYYFERVKRVTIIHTAWGEYEIWDKLDDIYKRCPVWILSDATTVTLSICRRSGKTEKYVYSQEWYENRYQPGICKSHENYIYGMGGGADIMTNDDCAS